MLLATGLVLAAALAGCAVGPDYRPPAPPDAVGYTPEPLADRTSADGSQRLVAGGEISGEWWTLFRSPALNALIARALLQNPDLEAAQASLREASASLAAEAGAFWPSLGIGAAGSRQKASFSAYGQPNQSAIFNLYTATATLSYTPDLFGGERRRVEALAAQEQQRRFALEATYLTLTGNLVTSAITEAALREQIATTEAIAATEAEQLEIVRFRLAQGAITDSEVLAQQAELAQTRAILPQLHKQLRLVQTLLAIYAGSRPDRAADDGFTLADLTLPDSLPVSLPSKLVEQRPDIRAAEAVLHKANADIGVAVANRFPQLILTGQYGRSSTDIANLFSPGNLIWSAASGVSQTVFAGGALQNRQKAAVAAFDRAAAQYRGAVLKGFGDVADALHALEDDAAIVTADDAAARAASASRDLAEKQFQGGAITHLSLLVADRVVQNARLALVGAKADRYKDTVALFLALGGGWWNRADVAS